MDLRFLRVVAHGLEEIVEEHQRLALDEHRVVLLDLMSLEELVEQEDVGCFPRESCWGDERACYLRLDLLLVNL